MIDALRSIKCTPNDLTILQSLRFGDAPYEVEISDWLRTDAPGFLHENRGAVWLYFNSARQCVGFTSLASDKWELVLDSRVILDIMYIPALGIDRRFQSVGAGTVPFFDRYPGQIMGHVIEEAVLQKGSMNTLGLLTHPENAKAAGIYQSKFGFYRVMPNHLEGDNPAVPYYRWIRKI